MSEGSCVVCTTCSYDSPPSAGVTVYVVVCSSLPSGLITRWRFAFHPAPGCYTLLGGDRLKVLSAHAVDEPHEGNSGEIIAAEDAGIRVSCGEGQLVITEAQLPGAKAQSVATLLRGHQALFQPGQRLGDANLG